MHFLVPQLIFMKCLLCALYWTQCLWPTVSKNKILSKFCLNFPFLLSLYYSIIAVYYIFLGNDNIMFGGCSKFTIFCYSFEENWKKRLTMHFSEMWQKIAAKPNNVWILMKSAVIPSIYWTRKAWNQKQKEPNLDKNWTRIEILFLKLKVTNIGSNRGRTECIS